jgi:hypothetical protein
MISPHLPRILIPFALLLAPALADAVVTTAVDFDAGGSIPTSRSLSGYSTSLGAQVGYRFDLGPVWIQPEVGGSFTGFHTTYADLDVPRIVGGARLGVPFARLLQVAVYAHGGVGWYGTAARGGTGTVGLALDVTPVRHFSVGAHVGYSGLLTGPISLGACVPVPPIPCTAPASSSIQWIAAGVHGGFVF